MNILLIIVFIVLILVGIGLAGYFGYKHFDKKDKSTLNEILFALGVVLAIVGFLGAIFVIIRARKGKKVKIDESADTPPLLSRDNQSYPGYPMQQQSYPGYPYPMQQEPYPGYPSPPPLSQPIPIPSRQSYPNYPMMSQY